MNHEQYHIFKDKYPDFDKDFVINIPLNMIDMDSDKSQVRTNGVNPVHSKELTSQIEKNGGNHTPISVVKMPSGRFELIAGVHRLSALKSLYDNGKNISFGTILAAHGFPELNFKSVEERVIYQLNENTPSAQLRCDNADYVESILRLIKENYVFDADITGENAITPEKLRAYIKENIENLSDYRVKKIAADIMAGLPVGQKKYRNYANKSEVATMFNNINPWGMNVESSGDSDKGYVIYFAGAGTAVKQNNLHGAFHYKTKHPSEKVLIVAYCGDVLSKTRDIGAYRRTLERNVGDINSSPLLRSDVRLIDGIVFLPQVLLGDTKECQQTLIIPASTIVTPTL
tara:strand:+ start:51 stop:1082 length:1032 start_codon:yes stop_codon:yes gene_type:complete